MDNRPKCSECQTLADPVGGEQIYPHRPDLFDKNFWLCMNCGAYVGCHPGTCRPLGTPAGRETRALRVKAHEVFDNFWKSYGLTRSEGYDELCKVLSKKSKEAHIGMCNAEECSRIIKHFGE